MKGTNKVMKQYKELIGTGESRGQKARGREERELLVKQKENCLCYLCPGGIEY